MKTYRMAYRLIVFILLAILSKVTFASESLNYRYDPLYQSQQLGQLPIAAWSNKTNKDQLIQATRPQLAGHWPRDVELLEDSLLRKHGRLLQGSKIKARKLIVQSYPKNTQSKARLRGFFAEAIYLDKHPDEHYVQKFNAKHNDVYRMVNNVPDGAQIKTKVKFSGPGYETDMRKDYLAKRFIVPDDHVVLLKKHLLEQESLYRNANDIKNADRTHRMIAKVRPLGATSSQLQTRMDNVYKTALKAETASYVNIGAAAGLGVASILWSYENGETSDSATLYKSAKALSLINTGVTTNRLLVTYKSGALSGTIKGNLITGAAIFAVDTLYLVYEQGGTKAFQQAEFWEESGGNISSLTLATIVGGYTALWTAPLGLPTQFVSTIASATIVGILGYVGGKKLTHEILNELTPEIALQTERTLIKRVHEKLQEMENQLKVI